MQEKVIKNVNLRFIGHFRLFYNVHPKFKMEVQKMQCNIDKLACKHKNRGL